MKEGGYVPAGKTGLLLTAVILAVALSACASVRTGKNVKPEISDEEAVAIAGRLAPEYGYNVGRMWLEELYDITPWEKRFPGLKFFDQPRYTDIEKKLEGRHYWTVNYVPNFPRYGGSFCVFIDADTGEVVDIFTGW